MKNITYLVIILFALSGCAKNQKIIKENCTPPDSINYVFGENECFRIHTFNAVQNPKALIVLIHGDVSSGGASDYFSRRVYKLNAELHEFVVVTLIRPGYFDSQGYYSTGSTNDRRDHYTAHNVDAIAAAIKNLAKFHAPDTIVVAGHSGGAAIIGSIIGRPPSLVDGAVLAACPCDIPRWRATRNSEWPNSLSPISYAKKIKDTQVVAIAGSGDKNTFPALMSDYIDTLKKSDIKASFKLLNGVSHNGTIRSDEFYNAIIELAK